MSSLSKFEGCLLGGLLGDVIGAVVEGESPGYIGKTYSSLDQILARKTVPEILGREWLVGRFTDDTQMSICVTQWLIEDSKLNGKDLLRRFSEAYRPARRYGSGVRWILEAFPDRPDEWKALSTIMFPDGSYGNGSSMRASPIGLRFHRDLDTLIEVSKAASRTTHSHPLAIQGATLQAAAVALAARPGTIQPATFLSNLIGVLDKIPGDTSQYRAKLCRLKEALADTLPVDEIASELGTSVEAIESVPMALCCFLNNLESYEDVIQSAVFVGGDTDTIACMAGSMSGAYLGRQAIPPRWLARVREEEYTPGRVKALAEELYRSML